MERNKKNIDRFRMFIFSWWEENKRDLPWRHTNDPYRILVSEIMLQQTQVSRVKLKYLEFIRVFPTVQALSQASLADIIRVWKGMGYNRRALYLKQAADLIILKFKGKFPKTDKELVQLPGVGTYTARAICIFAYRQDITTVDTNIRRIITHFFYDDVPQKEKSIDTTANELLPIGKSWEWHQALMDYGALVMQKTITKTKISHTPQIPFKKTDRFIRGKIIDRLREGTVKKEILISGISESYDRDRATIMRVLHDLEKEGLLQIVKKTCRLPK